MKRVPILFVMISFLTCLGIEKEKAQPIASPYHQVQFAELGARDQTVLNLTGQLEAQPEPEKHSYVSHAASNMRVALKLHRHKYQEHRSNIARIRTETDSRNVYGTAGWEFPPVSSTGPHYPPKPREHADNEASARRIESFDAYEQPDCGLWWKRVLSVRRNDEVKLGFDVQGLCVLNQSAVDSPVTATITTRCGWRLLNSGPMS